MSEISDDVRAAIKASRGVLSLRAAAAKFGVSSRTVGRIYHGGEHSTARAASSDALNNLQEQVTKLSEQLLALGKDVVELKSRQRFRQPLNPDLHSKPVKIFESNFSSRFRDAPGTQVVIIHGAEVQVPSPFDVEKKSRTAAFISIHPVSPGCPEYPYPQHNKLPENRWDTEADALDFMDPPAGKACGCATCKQWRVDLAYEVMILASYPRAVTDTALFRYGLHR